ncbi:MAG: MSH system minor pilin protein MshD [Idiomarinaceae bacterium HL-53]|nr:MAG: MSH system minor pilin protein MshD [Idiomarinaceae bacterium HL-53]CUS47451.1 MSHA pilin protein MshD [Idiomarinaceae bacterium HL-53]
MNSKARGFTLIEIVVGIVILGIALTILSSFVFPQARTSVEPIFQTRAAELGTSLLDEIMGKSFNSASDRSGGDLRCDEAGVDPCTPIPACPNTGARENFDSVDDYNCYQVIESALGDSVSGVYSNFELNVSVYYSDATGAPSSVTPRRYKTVVVTVTTPSNQAIEFSAVRGNF